MVGRRLVLEERERALDMMFFVCEKVSRGMTAGRRESRDTEGERDQAHAFVRNQKRGC